MLVMNSPVTSARRLGVNFGSLLPVGVCLALLDCMRFPLWTSLGSSCHRGYVARGSCGPGSSAGALRLPCALRRSHALNIVGAARGHQSDRLPGATGARKGPDEKKLAPA